MKIRLLTGAALGLALTLGLTVSAQRGGNGGPLGRPQAPPGRGRGGRGGGPDPVAETQRALNLTPAQADRLRILLDGRAQSAQRAQDEVQDKIDTLVALQDKPSPDAAELSKATQALRDAEGAQQVSNEKFRTDFLAMLTDEQKQALDRIAAAAVSADALSRLGVLNGPLRGRGAGPFGGFPGFLPSGPPPAPGPLPAGPPPAGPPLGGLAPLAPERVALGKRLFLDTQLSADGTMSCASCHDPARAFSDGRPVARGVHNLDGARNSPSLVNVAAARSYFWDGRALTLEHQVLGPITNPKELGLTGAELERRTGLPPDAVAEALASYVRTIRSSGSRYDAYRAGQVSALSAEEQAGLAIFQGRGRCATCHGGPNLTDGGFHNTGVAWLDGRFADEGRFIVSQNPRDHGAFKTPTLREVALTGPYMHDGSLKTLDDVVEFYSKGGRRNPYLDPRVRALNLSAGEKKALVAFLQSLSGHVTDGV
jgi:cytochrome c peroxidase